MSTIQIRLCLVSVMCLTLSMAFSVNCFSVPVGERIPHHTTHRNLNSNSLWKTNPTVHSVDSFLSIYQTKQSNTNLFSTFNPSVFMASMHSDAFYVLSGVFMLSTFGLQLEQKTTLGKALSAPLATMALALVVANLGIIPFDSAVYDFINKNIVALAIPLLLFDSNLKQVFTSTGPMLLAFTVGAISTVLATLITFPIMPLQHLQGWKIASALAARHIGGAINFVAVAETLSIDSSSISAAIAADNVVVALYFAFLFAIAKGGGEDKDHVAQEQNDVDGVEKEVNDSGTTGADSRMTMSSLAKSMTAASCLVTLGRVLTVSLPFISKGTSALPMISILTVVAATIFPLFFQKYRSTGTSVGVIFMQMFFAASGASGSIKLVLQKAPSLFAFSGLSIGLHFGCLMIIGRLFLRIKPNLLYLASNANVGGPTTAAAMAQAKEWSGLVLPALLVGILGYATATPIALALAQVLRGLSVL
jgi:uncharacterized membrane protein